MTQGNDIKKTIKVWIEEEDSINPPKGRVIRDKHRDIHMGTAQAIVDLEKEIAEVKSVIDSILEEKDRQVIKTKKGKK